LTHAIERSSVGAAMRRDRRILDEAAKLFVARGFHGVGVDEIGERAGVTGPAIYRHFSGKDEILARILDEAMDELMAATDPVHGDPALDLEGAISHHIDFAINQRHLVQVYQRDVSSLVEPWRTAFTRRRAEYSDRWEALFVARYPDLEVGVAATVSQACLGMIFSVAAWPERAASAAHVPETLEQLVRRGLAALE
jgi:AcrR family transcriptional regulator